MQQDITTKITRLNSEEDEEDNGGIEVSNVDDIDITGVRDLRGDIDVGSDITMNKDDASVDEDNQLKRKSPSKTKEKVKETPKKRVIRTRSSKVI